MARCDRLSIEPRPMESERYVRIRSCARFKQGESYVQHDFHLKAKFTLTMIAMTTSTLATSTRLPRVRQAWQFVLTLGNFLTKLATFRQSVGCATSFCGEEGHPVGVKPQKCI